MAPVRCLAIFRAISNSPYGQGHLINAFNDNLQVGDEFTCVVDRLALGGDSIASAPDGRIVFFRGAAPGDRVSLQVMQLKKRFIRARLLSREAGDSAQSAICTLYKQCGGCPWQVVQPKVQRAQIHAQLVRLLDRTFDDSVVCAPLQTFEPLVQWRASTRLHWRDGLLGYFKSQSDELVEIAECPVLAPPVPSILASVRAMMGRALKGQGTLRITARPGGTSGTVELAQTHGTPLRSVVVKRLLDAAEIHGVTLVQADQHHHFGQTVDQLGAYAVPHATGSFVQAHQRGNQALVHRVVEACQGHESVLEFYAGSGNFTIPLCEVGHRVCFVEIDEKAVRALERTLENRDLLALASGHRESANRVPAGHWDAVILDPPRSGAKQLCEQLKHVGARRIVYISCHPPSFMRDAKILNSGLWHLQRVEPFELFPHTGHVELIGIFERNS